MKCNLRHRAFLYLKNKFYFFILTFFLFFTTHCIPKPDIKKDFVNDQKEFESDAVIHHFLINSYEKNSLLWELKAQKAYTNWDNQNISIFKPYLSYINKKDQKITHVYGEKGRFIKEKNILLIQQNVVMHFHDGKKIFTDYLTWYKNKKLIKTNAPVKIIMPNGTIIRGIGLQTDTQLNKIKLLETTGKYLFKRTP